MSDSKEPILIFCCNPTETLEAQLVADTNAEWEEYELHLDSVEFPETRCDVCQEEDPEQTLTASGGILMCSECLEVTLDQPEE